MEVGCFGFFDYLVGCGILVVVYGDVVGVVL